MANSSPQKMDEAASFAMLELDDIKEKNPDGVKAVEDWVKKWYQTAGYKRLGKILADRWN
ncbi:hypothetical protein ACFLTO_02505 [Chloroflexota bacterium]